MRYSYSLIHGLFSDESKFILDQVNFSNIKTNSKALLYFTHNNIILNNITAENITCYGDNDNSSFILFDSGEIKKSIYIRNFQAKKCISNGPFIKVRGALNKFRLTKSSINAVKSYGPIIENLSEKVKIFLLLSF